MCHEIPRYLKYELINRLIIDHLSERMSLLVENCLNFITVIFD